MPETTATNVKIRQWKSQSIYRVKIIVERWKSGNIVKTINDRVKTKINIKTTKPQGEKYNRKIGEADFSQNHAFEIAFVYIQLIFFYQFGTTINIIMI